MFGRNKPAQQRPLDQFAIEFESPFATTLAVVQIIAPSSAAPSRSCLREVG